MFKNFSKAYNIIKNKLEKESKFSNEYMLLKNDIDRTLNYYFNLFNELLKSNLEKNIKINIATEIRNSAFHEFSELYNYKMLSSFKNNTIYNYYANEIHSYVICCIDTKYKRFLENLKKD